MDKLTIVIRRLMDEGYTQVQAAAIAARHARASPAQRKVLDAIDATPRPSNRDADRPAYTHSVRG